MNMNMKIKAIQMSVGFSLFTVSRGLSTVAATHVRGSTPESNMRRLIVDTDVGFDDIMAIGASIQNNRDIALLTTVHGMNKAAYGAQVLTSMFPSIPVKAGEEESPTLEQSTTASWIPNARKSFRDFLKENNIPMNDEALPKKNSAKQAVTQLLKDNPDETFDLLCLGPLSNVAEWLSDETLAPLVHSQIRSVWIMGGSLTKGEFNFGQAPQAANDVVSALSEKIYLVMDDDSGPQLATPDFTKSVTTIAERQLANDSSLRSWYAKIVQKDVKMAFWDPICAFAFMNQNDVSIQDIAVTIDAETGLVIESLESEIVLKRVSNVPLQDYEGWIQQLIENKEGSLTS